MMGITRILSLHDLCYFYLKSGDEFRYKEVPMKIYYSKFVGVGYLIFAAGVFIQIFFLLLHGLIDFSQLNLLTVIPTVLFFAAIYATIAGIKRLTSHRVSFEFTFEGIYVLPRTLLLKRNLHPQRRIVASIVC